MTPENATGTSRTLPLVSVVLPTYNRSTFLPAAFDAIRAQRIDSCEVVVVDDGSTDDTKEVVSRLSSAMDMPVRYMYQANQGAYGARNTGILASRGQYIACYDSDDVWLPQHLSTCVAALEQNADVDWVYSASEIVDLESGTVLNPNCFYQGGVRRPFTRLQRETRGNLHVITDGGAIRCQIDHGLFCGLQNSVIRRRVFEQVQLVAEYRNEAEDQLFAIRALAAGFRLAYVDDVHVRYNVHAGNSSGSAKEASLQKRVRVYELLVAGYERLQGEVRLDARETRALRRRIGRELFWHVGYSVYWAAGERREALGAYARALRAWPWSLRQWKTYAVARVRTAPLANLVVPSHRARPKGAAPDELQ